ncbi:dTDP-glucose 4,6-dehydratase [Candidatus Macondimonas diazotrophica]|uniref:dTDP-glucose 4,6-dehydratase n=1 Tax=Candidatus Macondimonas diazotrophica TaxID=2305248 RepID=A0A4Z0F7D6_9GAMM|nr:dTDP-glucose 4,6-dehydratase [Candidatus Macondimonas diazotrophica]TFZ81314.1 dTDP-glucose 4,6-dehydratase [Candidatus Macondimonas diazotrophica]
MTPPRDPAPTHTPRRLLVTGGAGFIGANFVHHWLGTHTDSRLVVLDALTYAGNQANLDPVRDRPELHFVHGDIRDTALVSDLLRAEAIDTLVHFAAESHVDRSIHGPDAFIDTNVNGTHSLLKAARQVWLTEQRVPAHRFHHVSTDEVYGSLGAADPAFTEITPYAPNSPYAASKAASDHLVRAYHHTYGLAVTTSNCSNNYGPYHFPEKLIPLCITNILHGKSLPIYGDGKNIRDWLYVKDHCVGIGLILEQGVVGETYNVGGENEWDNLSLVNVLCETMDSIFSRRPELKEQFSASPMANGQSSKELITFVTDRAGHDRRYAIDAKKIRDELGYKPSVDFEQGLVKTVDWYLENQDWWQPLLPK